MLLDMMVLGFDDYETQFRKLATALDIPGHIIQRHRFPDGESKLTLPEKLPQHILICYSLDHPNEKLVELLLAAKTARGGGFPEFDWPRPYCLPTMSSRRCQCPEQH